MATKSGAQPIGLQEFSRRIGESHADVSRAVRDGLLPALFRGGKRGPGNTVMDGRLAAKMAAAIACGVNWRDAAKMLGRIKIEADGVRLRRAA